MIELFELAPNDQSYYYLGQIFGVVGNIIPPQFFGTTKPPVILGEMFKVLNGIALTVGVLVVTYTTVVGLFATAAEGEFLGKKWSGLWVPIRTVLGIAGLFPSSGGYCAIQVFLLWVILQGVGAADVVWSTALNVIRENTNPNTSTPMIQGNVASEFTTIFKGLVCQASAYAKDPATGKRYTNTNILSGPIGEEGSEVKEIKYFCSSNSNSFCNLSLNDLQNIDNTGNSSRKYDNGSSFIRYNLGPLRPGGKDAGGTCGFVEYARKASECNSNANKKKFPCRSEEEQYNFLKDKVFKYTGGFNTLADYAWALVQDDYNYVKFYEATANDINNTNWPSTAYNYIVNYCMADPSKGGLGINNKKICCANPNVDACKAAYEAGFQSNSDINNRTSTGASNVSDNTVKAVYIPFGSLKDFNQIKVEVGKDENGNPIYEYQNFIQALAGQYTQQVIVNPFNETNTGTNTEWIDKAEKLGWLMAGAYYMYVAENVRTNISPHLVSSVFSSPQDPMKPELRNNLTTSAALIAGMTGLSTPSSSLTTMAPTQEKAMKEGYDNTYSVLARFINNLTTRGDPIASIAKSGQEMISAVKWLFSLYATTTAIISMGAAAGWWSFMGTGPVTSPFWAFFNQMMSLFGPFIIFLLASLFSAGVMLGIYVPLIPYIIYTITAVGWFIGVIEAMVAAPFVALGIMSPGGQHEILSRAEPSLMIIFNLFLRPALMVFGMIAAMLLSWAVVRMVNSAFADVAFAILTGRGIVEQVMFMIAYSMLIITVINKCYSLIHMLPERTLTYIGGHAIQYGEEQALQAVKGGVEAGAAGVAKAGKAGALAQYAKGKEEQKGRDEEGEI